MLPAIKRVAASTSSTTQRCGAGVAVLRYSNERAGLEKCHDSSPKRSGPAMPAHECGQMRRPRVKICELT